jgi:hypothetical protein
MNEEVRVEGIQHLLRALAGKLGENEVLDRELLHRAAESLDRLEWIASVALRIVDQTPKEGDGSTRSLIKRDDLVELMKALQGAGKRVKHIKV